MALASSVDFLVMGAGVAGLRAAIELADHGEVLVITKEWLGESNTHYAQGGIAVALADDAQDIALHFEDTISAGDGLVFQPAAQVLVAEGPLRVAELIEWGTRFDADCGKLMRTREGAHSLPRILHANGDATGAEISRSLVEYAHAHPRIKFAEWTMVTNLLLADGRVVGAELASANPLENEQLNPKRISARAILIASGGAGQVYSDTTNPEVATGDGLALALEAGAELADMEFYQFHPTAFSLAGAPRFLISEALRGEGAYLRNDRGERFMERYHPLLELAPRDVVARAITREGLGDEGETRPVYLDMRHVRDVDLHQRFPGISKFLARYSLDLALDLIPVRPAAHYLMGGIRTDLAGRTSVPGLYAAGEVACTGVHGANRLASNSLLEGLVFGARAAQAMIEDRLSLVPVPSDPFENRPLGSDDAAMVAQQVLSLRRAMWADGGLLRSASSLEAGLQAQAQCEVCLWEIVQAGKMSRSLFEGQCMARVAGAILCSALARQESRGAHFRSDYPRRDDNEFQKHSVFTKNGNVAFERW
ncbi:L-aspartate oxidase [Telmatobacter sp. DSM 110680]|uniref:L-aspartate oxidase n=1 Tax=Telmatobacter sp. DSM 110680 TaxID=3036704 RepID=A0AAU7DPS4_9BACT